MSARIKNCFEKLKARGEKALIPFIMAGDPNLNASQNLLESLPDAGADIIELGMPFSDPMADGPIIQRAGIRALKAETNLVKVLEMVKKFREKNQTTPLILMGYYNPIYHYGVNRFLDDAKQSGVDGFIIVDTPPEEQAEFCNPAREQGFDFITMVAPTTDSGRAKEILKNATGFVYNVAVTGITGTKQAGDNAMADLSARMRGATDLPLAVGFGIRTAADAKAATKYFDAIVVGSAIIEKIENNPPEIAMQEILTLVSEMKQAII